MRRALEAAGLPGERLRERDPPPWDALERAERADAVVSDYLARRRAARGRIEVSVENDAVLFSVRGDTAGRGWIAGLGGLVLRTTAGGHRWQRLPGPLHGALFSIAASGDRAVAAGETGLFEIAASGAAAEPSLATPGFIRELRFSPTQTRVGFAVGHAGRIFRTRDAGATWSQVWPPAE